MNAFLPKNMKNGPLYKDYQRIANEYQAKGIKIYWNNGYPSLDEKGLCNITCMFLYPSIVSELHEIDINNKAKVINNKSIFKYLKNKIIKILG